MTWIQCDFMTPSISFHKLKYINIPLAYVCTCIHGPYVMKIPCLLNMFTMFKCVSLIDIGNREPQTHFAHGEGVISGGHIKINVLITTNV